MSAGNFDCPEELEKALGEFENYTTIRPEEKAEMKKLLYCLAGQLDNTNSDIRNVLPVRWALVFMCYLKASVPRLYEDIGDNSTYPPRVVDMFLETVSKYDCKGDLLRSHWLALAIFMGIFGTNNLRKRLDLVEAYPEFHKEHPELASEVEAELDDYPLDSWQFDGMHSRYYDGMLRRIYKEMEAMTELEPSWW